MSRKITISMSERPPVSVNADDWPVIATAKWHDGQVECQANRRARVTVREHEDGRRLVYAWTSSAWQNERDRHAGYLLDASDTSSTVATIRRVADEIGDEGLGRDCIADLPAEDL
jgi:hypothetical protein